MKRILLYIAMLLSVISVQAETSDCYSAKEGVVPSFTEGVITSEFVQEDVMKRDLLQMLADFTKYIVADWHPCVEPNSKGEVCGFFNGENSGGSNEQGVRPNADLSMVCAFLVKYGKTQGVALPKDVTWDEIELMAMQSLVFAYSTHKANRLKVCSDRRYWGSTSEKDVVWESSLWAMSVAYSAYFQWDKLTEEQRQYVYELLKAECNYELHRKVPTGYKGDTKAEENGWEADVLAAMLGLFPDDALASQWFDKLRVFAVNSYSHKSDAENHSVIDEWYDGKTVSDLYLGNNLYDDYTLQNHNLFHTSYQNVVQQELGEAALAMKMFQKGLHGKEKWRTNALMHNCQEVQDSVLNWLALADGELAMPNGNDWSLFLYDQITSYSTMACFLRDRNALMLENMAYKYIKARQKTTEDGSWLLRPDVGARRMGVEAHRVMMTYLMHEMLPTGDMTPVEWGAFNKAYGEAKILPCQNIVRASTDSRFTCFSWSEGLKSYTGYFAANSPDKNKIVVPYRANNTGNILGWYEVEGKRTDAVPVVSGVYHLKGNGYVMNGELKTNDGALDNRFAIYSTPQNALIYIDDVQANEDCRINVEKGGLLAISTDELMKKKRTLYHKDPSRDTDRSGFVNCEVDGTVKQVFYGDWINIDNELGIVTKGVGKQMAFGDRTMNNSIYTSKLYPLYKDVSRQVKKGERVDARNVVYYSNQKASETMRMSKEMKSLKGLLPDGWNGVIAPDRDCSWLLVSNFYGADSIANLKGLRYKDLAPVFAVPTTVVDSGSEVTLVAQENGSVAMPVKYLLQGQDVVAEMVDDDTLVLTGMGKKTTVSVYMASSSDKAVMIKKNITIKGDATVKLCFEHGKLKLFRL